MNENKNMVSKSFDEQVKEQLIKTNSLVDHYRICLGLVDTPNINADMLSWVFTYLRLFSIKDMRLQMRHNYQTKDISHIQNELSMALSGVYVQTFSGNEAERALDRLLVRNIINFIPRGGGNGDELRLFILDMMRRHGIREGHRPGIDDPFLEEWHQKLHSCCTQEDITICEAYIVFQETNSHHLFYKTLWDRGRISSDFLKNMPHPLTHTPRYMPQLIPDLKHTLWILKQIHGGSQNFHYLLEVSRWQFDQELFSMLEEVKNNFGSWWIPGKIVDCRNRLKHFLKNNCPRDPLMIDVALDNRYKTSVEQIDLRNLNGDDLVTLISLTLQNICLSYSHEKITLCLDLWERIKSTPIGDKWSREWGLQALATLTFIQAMIQSYADELYKFIQPKAQAVGESCHIPESYVTYFAEEVIRSQNTFCLSKLIDVLFPILRQTAQIGSWKIISHGQGSALGSVKVIDSLLSVQGLPQEKPHIMIVKSVDGREDIPNWVTAILTVSDVDTLSHFSIRCRNLGVLLATCYEQALLERIKSYEGKTLGLFIEGGMVQYQENNLTEAKAPTYKRGKAQKKKIGSKSQNLQKMRGKLSDFINIPPSATIPFEIFEQTLQRNDESLSLFNMLTSELSSYRKDYPSILSRLRELIDNLTIPVDIAQYIQENLTAQKDIIHQWSESSAGAVISHIKKVWGSLWNERAYLSRISRNLNCTRLRMGVLIQKLIPADYSFIIHTRNPLSPNNDELLAEIVVGLGETLTGNSPGAPLCVISGQKDRSHTIISYPSKSIAYFDSQPGESLIVRSDSNDEDLPDFAGAGLYDSFILREPRNTLIHYSKERLFWDRGFQYFLFESLTKIAEEIEDVMKCPQDIEGVYSNNAFYVVQTRNQIGIPGL